MKAAVFKQPGTPLAIEEVNDPEPGPDDLILKVKACGILWHRSALVSRERSECRLASPGTRIGHGS